MSIDGIRLASPVSLTSAQLQQVHTEAYVRSINTGEPQSLAMSQGFQWDPNLWRMVTASNGGAVAAALSALSDGVADSLSSGLHHARPDRGAAFCTFNGLALAAMAALDAGARQIHILDLDAHCGGGTAACIAGREDIWQVDISTCYFDSYEKSERLRLEVVGRSVNYLPCLEYHLAELDRLGLKFSLCIYNAGMDPHEGCGTGGLQGITAEILAQREKVVFSWCRQRDIPVAFVTAGGYLGPNLNQHELVGLHCYTLHEAARSYRDCNHHSKC